jgi:dihydropteroate synthase
MGGERDWLCRDSVLTCGVRTLVMGIVNVTPDSFSDGGTFLDPDVAVEHGLRLAAEGADVLDVGGESTRPGSEAVPAGNEIARVVPVVERLVKEVDVPISVDTRKPDVARAALDAGASIVNDISAGAAPGMFEVVRNTNAGMVLMHMQGEPETMQRDPSYGDVVAEVAGFLRRRLEVAISAGIDRDRLCVDPGIGFGKNLQHNLSLLRSLPTFRGLGVPLLVGPSRKGFLGELTGVEDPRERVGGTAAAVAWCAARGADLVRVHDVKEIVSVVRVIDAIVRGAP